MELLSVSSARSIWLFDISDLNPRGKSFQHDLLEWLKDSYQFSKFPKSVDDLDETKGLAFSEGHFQVKEELFIRVALKIYNDGIVGETCSSTEDTDAFLKDVIESAVKEFSLTWSRHMVRKTLYSSQVYVRLEKRLYLLRPELEQFGDKITSLVGAKSPWGFAQIGFWPDTESDTNPMKFSLERQLGRAFEENRYFSTAPLKTDTHLEMLSEFEKLLT